MEPFLGKVIVSKSAIHGKFDFIVFSSSVLKIEKKSEFSSPVVAHLNLPQRDGKNQIHNLEGSEQDIGMDPDLELLADNKLHPIFLIDSILVLFPAVIHGDGNIALIQ